MAEVEVRGEVIEAAVTRIRKVITESEDYRRGIVQEVVRTGVKNPMADVLHWQIEGLWRAISAIKYRDEP